MLDTVNRPTARAKSRKSEQVHRFVSSQTMVVAHRPAVGKVKAALRSIIANIGEGRLGADICRDLADWRDNPRQ